MKKNLIAIPLACILSIVTLTSAGAAPARSSVSVGCGDVAGLVQAITAANAAGGTNDISLSAGCTYTLTAVNNTDPIGGPNGLPVITGNLTLHGNNSIVTRSSSAPSFRIFQVGDIDTPNAALLALDAITLTGGDMPGAGQIGGGILIFGGTLRLMNSTMSGNRAYWGGAIGICYGGAVEVNHSTFSRNTGTTAGGGIASAWSGLPTENPRVKVVDSSFSDNFGSNGGGIRMLGGTLDVARSTFSGNSSDWGGGLFLSNSQNTVSNSTLFSNSAIYQGGGIYTVANLQVVNTTFSQNKTPSGDPAGGPALYLNNMYGATVTVKNSLFADSGCYGISAASDGGHNLDRAGSCNFGSANGSLSNVDPKLAASLADNGGPTKTIGLMSGSPAVDAGDDIICGGTVVGGVDQRGIARPQGAHCDIGAFEGTLKTDSTPPTITITSPTNTAYLLGQVVTASYTCQDEAGGSGLASCVGTVANGANINTALAGTQTFVVTAADNAGNTSSRSVNYTVKYSYSGFQTPVNNPPTLNTGKAGRTYPVKWQLTDANGNWISDLGAVTSITYKATSCTVFTGDATDALESEASGGSSLRYDSTSNQFVYNWATPGAGCYTLFLTLKDGMQYPAYFDLK